MNPATSRRQVVAYGSAAVCIILALYAVTRAGADMPDALRVPFEGPPSVEDVLGDARDGWGVTFIADEMLYAKTNDWIGVYAPGQVDTELAVGFVTLAYDEETGHFELSVVDQILIEVGGLEVGGEGATVFEVDWFIERVDPATMPQLRAKCKCSHPQGGTAEAECEAGERPICECTKQSSRGTCVAVKTKCVCP